MMRWRRALCFTAFILFPMTAVGWVFFGLFVFGFCFFFEVPQYLGKEVQHLHFIIVPPQTNVKMVLEKLTIGIHLVFTR